jgi:hypothetical protein
MAAELAAGKDNSRAAHCCAALQSSSVSVLGQAERLQRWPIDSRSKRQAIVGLERRRFGRDSGPDCVRRLDFSADVRRCDFFDQACC